MSAKLINGIDTDDEAGRHEEAVKNVLDQYTRSSIGSIWQDYIGSGHVRTNNYRRWLIDLLNSKRCHSVLDAACGTGLVEQCRKNRPIRYDLIIAIHFLSMPISGGSISHFLNRNDIEYRRYRYIGDIDTFLRNPSM
jgi:hypothetical protein